MHASASTRTLPATSSTSTLHSQHASTSANGAQSRATTASANGRASTAGGGGVFRASGNRNQTLRHLFSAYEYTAHSTGIPYESTSRPLRTAPEGATRQSSVCPTRIYPDTHRGLTALRARSLPSHFPTNAPHAEWVPAPYADPLIRDTYRRVRSGGDGLKEWKGGAKPFELLDPEVRRLDPDATTANLTSNGAANAHSGAQIRHPAPFLGGSSAKSTRDKSYISGHEQYAYKYAPFEEYELPMQSRQDDGRHLGAGFRPNCDHIHHAFQRSGPAGLTPTETDRNPRFESVRAPDERCYHFRRGY